jgi:hypothetical protein
VPGQCLGSVWAVSGQCLGSVWAVSGQCLGSGTAMSWVEQAHEGGRHRTPCTTAGSCVMSRVSWLGSALLRSPVPCNGSGAVLMVAPTRVASTRGCERKLLLSPAAGTWSSQLELACLDRCISISISSRASTRRLYHQHCGAQHTAGLCCAGHSRAAWNGGDALVLPPYCDEHLGRWPQVAAALHQGPHELAPLREAYCCVALLQLWDVPQCRAGLCYLRGAEACCGACML